MLHERADLMVAFAVYLGLTLVVGVLLRLRHYKALTSSFLELRSRLPRLYGLLVSHWRLFLAWPFLVYLGLAAVLLVAHVVAFRFVFLDAAVTLAEVATYWPGLVGAVVVGAAMVALDAYELFFADRPEPPRVRPLFFIAEATLASKGPVSLVSRGVISRMVRHRILRTGVELNPWFRRWAGHLAVRFVFGLVLWWTWLALDGPGSV